MWTIYYFREDGPWLAWSRHETWETALAEAQPLLCVPSVQAVKMTDPDGQSAWGMNKAQIVKAWSLHSR